MPITYDRPIEEDGLYQIGVKEGVEKGIQKGELDSTINIVKKLLTELSTERVAGLLDLDIDFVRSIQDER